MQNTDNKKEQGMGMIEREKYEYTPKEGFVLTHFLTVADIKLLAITISFIACTSSVQDNIVVLCML